MFVVAASAWASFPVTGTGVVAVGDSGEVACSDAIAGRVARQEACGAITVVVGLDSAAPCVAVGGVTTELNGSSASASKIGDAGDVDGEPGGCVGGGPVGVGVGSVETGTVLTGAAVMGFGCAVGGMTVVTSALTTWRSPCRCRRKSISGNGRLP